MDDFKPQWENDPENPSFWDNPVTPDEFWGTLALFKMMHFERFMADSVLDDLAKIGIIFSRKDNLILQVALKTFHQGPSVHYSPEAIAKEERILNLAQQLRAELSPELESDENAVREYWGDEVDQDDPEPSEYLYLGDFIRSLDLLTKCSFEHMVWLASAKTMDVEPQSNRANRMRYFYWLLLLGFWKYALKHDLGTSSTDENEGSGPLVRFIQIMSKGGGLEFNELSGTAIRQWVRRNKNKTETIRHFFEW